MVSEAMCVRGKVLLSVCACLCSPELSDLLHMAQPLAGANDRCCLAQLVVAAVGVEVVASPVHMLGATADACCDPDRCATEASRSTLAQEDEKNEAESASDDVKLWHCAVVAAAFAEGSG
jgi:hypothetical protein